MPMNTVPPKMRMFICVKLKFEIKFTYDVKLEMLDLLLAGKIK